MLEAQTAKSHVLGNLFRKMSVEDASFDSLSFISKLNRVKNRDWMHEQSAGYHEVFSLVMSELAEECSQSTRLLGKWVCTSMIEMGSMSLPTRFWCRK